jgi:hypothetical protein
MSEADPILPGAPGSGGPRWWQWLTVLSLDAPAVTLAWQWLLARCARVELAWPHAFVLGASVWLAYAADRWIEGWRLHPERAGTQRHTFYVRQRWPMAVVWLVVFTADVAVALLRLSRRDLEAGLVLLAAVLAYLFSHQLVHRHHNWRVPKEICVAALLGAGTALFIVTQPGADLLRLTGPLGQFTLLCFTNCVLISVWEQEVDQARGQTSFALQFAGGAAFARQLPALLALLALPLLAVADGAVQTAAACTLAASAGLALLDRAEPRLGWPLARVLADIVLLTPLFPLLLGWPA